MERALRTVDLVIAASTAVYVLTRWAPLAPTEGLPALVLGVVGALAFPIAMSGTGLYASQRREALARVAARLLMAAAVSSGVLAGTTLALGLAGWSVPVALLSLAQLVAFSIERIGIHALLRWARRSGRNYRRVAIVGTGPRARAFAGELAAHPQWGLQIAAFLDDGDVSVDPHLSGEKVWKLIDFPDLARSEVIDELVIALPRSLLPLSVPLVEECARLGVPVSMLSDVFCDALPAVQAGRYGRLAVLRFGDVAYGPVSLTAKRLLDVAGAAALLLVFAPIMAAAALAIRLTSPGPLLYRQIRLGLNGRPFEFLKFRSMVVDAEERLAELAARNEMTGPVFKMRHDPRVTPVGRVIRRWSIDELPQLWNVLRGDMSLVGPRPPLPNEVDRYESKDRRRISVRPGITCLWQINGRNRIQFDDWVELDLHYIDHWSLALDLWILVCTPLAVLRRDGAS